MKILLFFSLLLVCVSCSKETTNAELLNCDRISSMTIIDEDQKGTVCIFEQVYRYQDVIYTVCECCICDKISFPTDCDGETLCETGSEECFIDFYRDAVYLYSVSE